MKYFSDKTPGPKNLILMAVILLSGCASLSPTEPAHTYLLEAKFDRAAQPGLIPLTLIISQPHAVSGYETDRMVYVRQPHLLESFAKNHWAETPARMLSPILVNALETGTGFKAVATAAGATKGDLRLDTEIMMLRQDFSTVPSTLHMVLRMQLVEQENYRILATQTFDAFESAPTDDPKGGVIAANQLLPKLLDQIAEFVVRQGMALIQHRK